MDVAVIVARLLTLWLLLCLTVAFYTAVSRPFNFVFALPPLLASLAVALSPILPLSLRALLEQRMPVFLVYARSATLSAYGGDPFSEPDSPDNIEFLDEEDGTHVIRYATLPKLVEYMTHPSSSIPADLVPTVLLTHRGFTTTTHLVSLLIERFMTNRSSACLSELPREERENAANVIRLRVLSIFKQWVTRFPSTIYNEPACVDQLRHFASVHAVRHVSRAGELLSLSIERGAEQYAQTLQPPPKQFDNSYPKSRVKDKSAIDEFRWTEIDVLEFARQITLLDHQVYSSIKPSELVHQAWTKRDKHERAPHVVRLAHMFNSLCAWARSEILIPETAKERAAVVERLILIAQNLRNLNNFSSAMAIVAAFEGAAIMRLKLTWAAVDSKHMGVLDKLKALFTRASGYKNYRHTLRSSNPPMIPYIGMQLSDLVFIDEGNRDTVNNANCINFTKYRGIHNVLLDIMVWQQCPYCLIPIPALMKHLAGLRSDPSDDDIHYARSLEVEPRTPRT